MSDLRDYQPNSSYTLRSDNRDRAETPSLEIDQRVLPLMSRRLRDFEGQLSFCLERLTSLNARLNGSVPLSGHNGATRVVETNSQGIVQTMYEQLNGFSDRLAMLALALDEAEKLA